MTTDTMPTGIDIEAMAREAAAKLLGVAVDRVEYSDAWLRQVGAVASIAIEHAATIAERMGLDAQSDEAKRLAVEIGAAIRAEA